MGVGRGVAGRVLPRASTFTLANLSLTRDGQPVALGPEVTITPGTLAAPGIHVRAAGASSFVVGNLQSFTSAPGTYVLTVNPAGILDLAGVRVHEPRVTAVQMRARCGGIKPDLATSRPEAVPRTHRRIGPTREIGWLRFPGARSLPMFRQGWSLMVALRLAARDREALSETARSGTEGRETAGCWPCSSWTSGSPESGSPAVPGEPLDGR
jgi:hypothetical protein